MEKLEQRALWMAIFLITSMIIGIAGGVLCWLAGAHPATAIVAGASGFAAAILLFLAVAHFLSRAQS
ncbi:hypothetical protein ACWDR1_29025 [Streptosporangium sandarakinum]